MNSNSTLRPRIRGHLLGYIEQEAQRLGTDDLGMVVNRMLEDHKLYLGSLACVEVPRQVSQNTLSAQPTNQAADSEPLPVEALADEYADLLDQAI